eukprot:TRINITY_DN120862_c0_g1_i1.p1 TRINITY_DN120862_c0_g1~~TRINITY_DN120862_c0_g1_i1.p1  ORF type:complete len:174 (-),score=32.46 TRINITY_DN120862_c0_g1_i1:239-703(-)
MSSSRRGTTLIVLASVGAIVVLYGLHRAFAGQTTAGARVKPARMRIGKVGVYSLASPAEIEEAKIQGALVVDIRGEEERMDGPVVPGSVLATWNGRSIPLDKLPEDKDEPIIIHCKSGGRTPPCKQFLESQGYTNVVDAGGPMRPQQWDALVGR